MEQGSVQRFLFSFGRQNLGFFFPQSRQELPTGPIRATPGGSCAAVSCTAPQVSTVGIAVSRLYARFGAVFLTRSTDFFTSTNCCVAGLRQYIRPTATASAESCSLNVTNPYAAVLAFCKTQAEAENCYPRLGAHPEHLSGPKTHESRHRAAF